MFERYQHPVWFENAGWVIRRFTGNTWNFYTVTSIPDNVPAYEEPLRAFVNRITGQFYTAIQSQPYYDRFPYDNFIIESILMYPTREAAVHLGVQFLRREYCTIREVFTKHNLTNDLGAVMEGMALELHILQHVRDHNIITLLSIERDVPLARHILLYELSIPLLHYIRKRAFRNRESISVFDDENIPKYIIKCVISALQSIFAHSICLNGQISTAGIYLDLIGRVKLGSFIHAIKSDNPADRVEDLAAVGGIYTALVNRTFRDERVNAITNTFPNSARPFYNAYFHAQGAFPGFGGGENPELSQENLAIARHCLEGPTNGFNNIIYQFGLQNVPDMSNVLAVLIQRIGRCFRDPLIDEDLLSQPPNVDPLEHPSWIQINVNINLTLNFQNEMTYLVQNFNNGTLNKKLFDVIYRYLSHIQTVAADAPPNPAVNAGHHAVPNALIDADYVVPQPPEDDEPMPLQANPADADHHVPDYFDPPLSVNFLSADILTMYPLFMSLFNSVIHYVENNPDPIIGYWIFQSIPLDRGVARRVHVKMTFTGGIRTNHDAILNDMGLENEVDTSDEEEDQ